MAKSISPSQIHPSPYSLCNLLDGKSRWQVLLNRATFLMPPRELGARKLSHQTRNLNYWSTVGLQRYCLKSPTEDEQQCWQAQDRARNGSTFENLCFEPLFGFIPPAVKLTYCNPPSFQGYRVLSSPLTFGIMDEDPLQFETLKRQNCKGVL